MDRDLKSLLRKKLDDVAPEYDLTELTYPSFVRFYGYESQPLSASDAVEGISTLLDVAEGVRMEVEIEGMRNGGEWFGGGRIWEAGSLEKRKNGVASGLVLGDIKNGQKSDKDNQNPMWWRKNFWAAYDSLKS